MAKKLTGRQKAFAEAYLTNGMNATQAARSAGYRGSYNVLSVQGHNNLRNDKIRAYINARLKAHKLTADEVLAKLSEQAAADISEFLNADGSFDFQKAKRRKKTHLIKKITVTRRKTKVAGQEVVTEKVTLELHNAQTALELLGKHHKVFTEQLDITSGGQPIELMWPKSPSDDEESD